MLYGFPNGPGDIYDPSLVAPVPMAYPLFRGLCGMEVQTRRGFYLSPDCDNAIGDALVAAATAKVELLPWTAGGDSASLTGSGTVNAPPPEGSGGVFDTGGVYTNGGYLDEVNICELRYRFLLPLQPLPGTTVCKFRWRYRTTEVIFYNPYAPAGQPPLPTQYVVQRLTFGVEQNESGGVSSLQQFSE